MKKQDEQALADLEEGMKYCNNDVQVTKQLYVQRGMIYELRNQDEDARRDFEVAAKHGSKFAKQECIKLNPYARLCNQMLEQAIKELSYS